MSLAFDHRVLVNASAINMLTEQGYRYRLVSKPGGDGADVQEYLLAGEEKRQPDWAVTYELKLPQVHWHLYLWNDHGFYPHLSWLLVILIVVASALVAGLYAFAEFSRWVEGRARKGCGAGGHQQDVGDAWLKGGGRRRA